jgi:hypothetical protein
MQADLIGADLRHANLRGANLVGADLRRTRLLGANLKGATGIKEVPRSPIPGLAQQVLEQITQNPESLNQKVWHSSCGTAHCTAGWTVVLSGPIGLAAEKRLGTRGAAEILLGGSNHPFGIYDDPIPWLKEMAANS